MKITKVAISAASAVALLAAAACGGAPGKEDSQSSANSGPDTSTSIGDVMNPDAKGPAPAIEGVQKGGTLTVPTTQAPETLDPTRAYYVDSTEIMRLYTRSLTAWRNVPGGKGMELVPDLATDLGKSNKDKTEWTFTLKEGLKYDNGRPVKAEDVAYAIKRQFATEELPAGPLYGQDFYLDGDKYKGPFKDGDNFRAVEVKDDRTLTLKMRRPFADLSFYASFPNFSPIPKDKDTKADYERNPLSTGPYKVEKYSPQKGLTLVRNDQWDPKTDPARSQNVDKFVFKFGQDSITLQRQLVANKGVDQTSATYDALDAKLANKVLNKEPEKRLVSGRSSCVYYTYMDLRKIPKKVREAIAVAWPTDQLLKVAGAIPGLTAYPATSLLPSVTPGYQESDVIGRKGKGNGDPEKAKEMLKKAGEEGFELVWYYDNKEKEKQKANQARKSALEEAGFTVNDIGVSTEQIRGVDSEVDTKSNLKFKGWCTDWASGSTVFPAQWDPRKTNTAGAPNPAFPTMKDQKWIADEIDRIFQISDLDKAATEWGKLDKKIMEKELPIVPYYQSGDAYLHGSKVKNLLHDEILGMPNFTNVWLEQ